MEEKNEFSDILLERDSEAKASKFKKLALIAGSFILIFLLVLVVMKMLNKPSAQENDSRLAIEPKNTNNKETQVKQNDPLFKEVPIIKQEDKKESFEEMVRKLKAKEKNRATQGTTKPKEVAKAPEIKDIEKKEVAVPIKKTKTKPAVKPVQPKTKAKSVKKVAKVAKPKKSKIVIPTIPSPKSPTTNGSVAKGTYIQVLATTQTTPDKKFLNSLVKKGYTYHLHRTTIKNKKYLKILVGPYGGYSVAKKALPKVQQDVSKNAFVFNLK